MQHEKSAKVFVPQASKGWIHVSCNIDSHSVISVNEIPFQNALVYYLISATG